MKRKIIFIIFVVMGAIPFIGYSAENPDSKQVVILDKKPLYWIDTMEPNVHYTVPGKSRMGMELVPVYSEKKKQ